MCVVSSAWMFFLGLMVGRGTVPPLFDIPKLERQLADLAQPDTEAGQKVIPQPDIPAPELFEALKAPDQVLNIPAEKPTDTPALGPMKTKRPPAHFKKKTRTDRCGRKTANGDAQTIDTDSKETHGGSGCRL